jgi:predicted membrane-bound mannosyltransferase
MRVATLLGFEQDAARTVVFIVGGILGVILVVWLFNWALITISSLAGASMVVSGLFMRPTVRPLVFLGLVLLGVLFQGLSLWREASSPKSKPVQKE